MIARGRRRNLIGCGLLVAVVASGCSNRPAPKPGGRFGATYAAAPLPATSPYLIMTGASAGWAVLPSSGAWLLVHTSDGFAHVVNRTPAGIETAGGLVGAFVPSGGAVAVEAHDRLLRSPLLTDLGSGTWMPAELPDAVTDARGAVSIGSATPTVVTRGGAVLARTSTSWRTMTDAARLSGGGQLRLDAVTWASASVGWVTAHGPAGGPLAFQTADAGVTWSPVPDSSGAVVAALAPCGAGPSWLLPVIDDTGSVTVLRTTDAGGTWARGPALQVAGGAPAWSCHGDDVWMAARGSGTDHVFASADGGSSWADSGPAPAGLSDVAITGPGVGFAVSGGAHPQLWSVSNGGSQFTPVALPGWIGTLGGQSGGD